MGFVLMSHMSEWHQPIQLVAKVKSPGRDHSYDREGLPYQSCDKTTKKVR